MQYDTYISHWALNGYCISIVASNRICDQPDDGLEKKAETCSS